MSPCCRAESSAAIRNIVRISTVYANSHRVTPGPSLDAVAVMPVSRAPTDITSSLGLELAEMRMGEVVLGDMIVIDRWSRPMQRYVLRH